MTTMLQKAKAFNKDLKAFLKDYNKNFELPLWEAWGFLDDCMYNEQDVMRSLNMIENTVRKVQKAKVRISKRKAKR